MFLAFAAHCWASQCWKDVGGGRVGTCLLELNEKAHTWAGLSEPCWRQVLHYRIQYGNLLGQVCNCTNQRYYFVVLWIEIWIVKTVVACGHEVISSNVGG